MKNLISWEETQVLERTAPWALFYLSLPGCGVCTALKPKVEAMAKLYDLPVYYVDLEKIPEAGGQWSVFTIPGILFYVQGKEIWRGARFINLLELEECIDRYKDFLGSSAGQ